MAQEIIKEEIVGAVKKTAMYKLLKTSEAVLVMGGLAAGIIFGFVSLLFGVILMAAYAVLNISGLSNEPLYVVRDEIKEKYENKVDAV